MSKMSSIERIIEKNKVFKKSELMTKSVAINSKDSDNNEHNLINDYVIKISQLSFVEKVPSFN